MRYADEWKRVVRRLARWVDMEDDYRTMDATFMESVWWVFKQLHDKGLVYKGFKVARRPSCSGVALKPWLVHEASLMKPLQVMPFSTACSTSLSNFEANLNYKEVVSFPRARPRHSARQEETAPASMLLRGAPAAGSRARRAQQPRGTERLDGAAFAGLGPSRRRGLPPPPRPRPLDPRVSPRGPQPAGRCTPNPGRAALQTSAALRTRTRPGGRQPRGRSRRTSLCAQTQASPTRRSATGSRAGPPRRPSAGPR